MSGEILASSASVAESLSRKLILGSQLVFNIGFYAVVPFLAVHMAGDLAMSSRLIGIVLGVRTFCQQGLFFVGGLLAERFGSRRLMLAGCLVRTGGYLAFAFAESAWGMLLGACLTGAGGAMFSPCLEALTAEAERQAPAAQCRPGLFALFAIFGEMGAIAGPLLGSVLIGFGFRVMALACAMLFLATMWFLSRHVPARVALPEKAAAWRDVAGNGPFLRFILFYSAYLFSYNQMYFGLPLELARIGGGAREMAGLFILASLMLIGLQMPVAVWCRRRPPGLPLTLGFSFFAAAFACLALASFLPWFSATAAWGLRFAPITAMVVLLTTGQMFAVPVAMSMVPDYARQSALPAYYGALASAGGCAVLAGNFLLGLIFDMAGGAPIDGAGSGMGRKAGYETDYYALAWCVAACLPALSAAYFSSRFWKAPSTRG